MANRGISLLIDVTMLAVYAVLLSWRLTGVPVHEWLGAALTGVIVVHLLVHWEWVESRVRQLLRGGSRTRVNMLLNASLFAAMGTTIVSGVYISKVLVPNALAPGVYLAWHGVHDAASMITILILGLHVALNWDLVVAIVRRAADRTASPLRPSRARGPVLGPVVGRLAWITTVSVVLVFATAELGRLLPGDEKVMLVSADGRRALVDPPAEITRLRPGTERPAAGAPVGRSVVGLGLLSIAAVVGRKVLKVRLG